MWRVEFWIVCWHGFVMRPAMFCKVEGMVVALVSYNVPVVLVGVGMVLAWFRFLLCFGITLHRAVVI